MLREIYVFIDEVIMDVFRPKSDRKLSIRDIFKLTVLIQTLATL